MNAQKMEAHFVNIDGNRIRYLEAGDPKNGTIVLLHGLGGSADRWSKVGPLFAKHFRVVIPDLIGFGYSEKPSLDYTIELFELFLDQFIRTICHQRIFLVGASLGGQIAAMYTFLHPASVSKLVLVSPAGVMKSSTPALNSYVTAAMYPTTQNVSIAFQTMECSDEKPDENMINDFITRMKMPNAKMTFMSTTLNLKNSYLTDSILHSINHPTLLIWGSDDPVIPIRYAGYFTSAIPNNTLFSMENCGHAPYNQKPETFAKRVVDFFLS